MFDKETKSSPIKITNVINGASQTDDCVQENVN